MSDKQRILIADDSEMNRAILTEMLGEEYEILEAENGQQAIEMIEKNSTIDLLLLDIMMPVKDGFDVLTAMNQYHWIDELPVIMISAESATSFVERAYDLGATDYISRPFDMAVVRRRVVNALMLYGKQKRLMQLVADQIYENEKSNSLMITILSHIVEFRNGESGLHVLHIRTFTEMILRKLITMTDKYPLTETEISLITMASALHDIGKINIPETILNKPGKLTQEEFGIMKTHTTIGDKILHELPFEQDAPLVKTARQICRWHHERYDGRGYPDGLKGDDIPIGAQAVALADVYDALTSERCYKKAFDHDTALHMILNGECGTFNPLLMECLVEISEDLRSKLHSGAVDHDYLAEAQQISAKVLHNSNLPEQDNTSRALSASSIKTDFFFHHTHSVQFDYSAATNVLTLSDYAVRHLHGLQTQQLAEATSQYFFSQDDMGKLQKLLHATTPQNPEVKMRAQLPVDGKYRWFRVYARAIWSDDTTPVYLGAVGECHPVQGTELPDKGENVNLGTTEGVQTMMRGMEQIFDVVRLVDVKKNTVWTFDEAGKLKPTDHPCHAVWNKNLPCSNCSSFRAFTQHSQISKLEFNDGKTYQVLSKYIEVDGTPCVLELVSKLKENPLLTVDGRNLLSDNMSAYSQALYRDPLTNAYNRRYYTEQSEAFANAEGVAMIDVDNFKAANDTYGHQAGDETLRLIVRGITDCIRSSDILIRYGGDEFLLFFPSIPSDIFASRLEEIRRRVESITVPGCPNFKPTVSIGGVYGAHPLADAIHRADLKMYDAKHERNHVSVSILPPPQWDFDVE